MAQTGSLVSAHYSSSHLANVIEAQRTPEILKNVSLGDRKLAMALTVQSAHGTPGMYTLRLWSLCQGSTSGNDPGNPRMHPLWIQPLYIVLSEPSTWESPALTNFKFSCPIGDPLYRQFDDHQSTCPLHLLSQDIFWKKSPEPSRLWPRHLLPSHQREPSKQYPGKPIPCKPQHQPANATIV